MGVSNPKAILFFATLFPQFIAADLPLVAQFITLTGTLMLFSFSALMTYALLAIAAKNWLALPHRAKFFNRLPGTAFVLLGLGMLRLKNALMVKVHESQFRLIAGEDALAVYQFHTMTARHFFCKVCGIYPFHRKRITPDHLGVNVFCLHDFDPTGIPVRLATGAQMA